MKRQELIPAEVVSPYQNAEKPDEIQTEIVMRNRRHDVLEMEFSAKRIDEAEKAAGDRLMAIFLRAGIGGAQAIDYGKTRVDGAVPGEVLTEAVASAHQELRRIRARLGRDFWVLEQSIGNGKTLKEVADMWRARPRKKKHVSPQRAQGYVSYWFRDALGELVLVFGVAKGKADQGVRTWRDTHTPLTGL